MKKGALRGYSGHRQCWSGQRVGAGHLMSLSGYKVVAGLAVSDMERARKFYEGKLGLSVAIDSGDNVAYRCAGGSVLHVYLSPDHAGSSATLASWYVDDVEGVVD